jgi:beta-xylosidase
MSTFDNKKHTSVWVADNGDGTYRNPILFTDYSDPDVVRVGEDFYMVASSFCNSPAIPLLHSKDLVNWKVVNYVLDKIPYPDYEVPAHGRGVWAPAIRYHDNKFWVFFPMPDEGIFMSTAEDPLGKWSEPMPVWQGKGWIDPCPFWDDDGKAYLVNAFAMSRIGFKSILQVSPMKPDGTGLLDEGKHVFDGHENQPNIEGPKFYKRNGYYYIFAPAGGVTAGWQAVLRSENIYGPYEDKIVMHQGNTTVNGPHQGGLVELECGEFWFIHFQDAEAYGRIVHLQPVTWVDDWPIIGRDIHGGGIGEPVSTWKKPEVGGNYPIIEPEASDEFETEKLGLQWQWNANYKNQWYSLKEREGYIRLYSISCPPVNEIRLCDIPSLLLQKFPAPKFTATVKLELYAATAKEMAGLIVLGDVYSAAVLTKTVNGYKLSQITGRNSEKEQKDKEIC